MTLEGLCICTCTTRENYQSVSTRINQHVHSDLAISQKWVHVGTKDTGGMVMVILFFTVAISYEVY